MNIINIALDLPLSRLFSYTSPNPLEVGQRVIVKFNNRQVIGFVWQVQVDPASVGCNLSQLKPIITVLPEILPQEIITLIQFVASYYHYPLGQTLFTLVPSALRKLKQFTLPKDQVISLTLPATQDSPKFKSKKQQLLYQTLKSTSLDLTAIKAILGANYLKVINAWQQNNLITQSNKLAIINPIIGYKLHLNDQQRHIVKQISNYFGSYHPSIVYGVTGSGKTEVYLELIEQVIIKGQQVLVLVPEINLTPQLLDRFNKRFPNLSMHILTSNVSEKERLIGYWAAAMGSKQIIIGTRLSIFTPFKNLGLIIVDEEHDQSFKQNEGLRYHARDLAIWRANYLQIPIILGSATPSLETLYNYKLHKYTLYKLTNRAVDCAVLPNIKLIDLNACQLDNGLAPSVIQEIAKRLEQKELSLVFINRRGYSPVVTCYECGWVSSCKHCSTNMVYHQINQQLKCHHCGWSRSLPIKCPRCSNQYLQTLGQGSQKVEESLAVHFPTAKICRIDQDTTKSKQAWHELYNKINRQEVDILVGTQMLAKGHDFHNLTLVIGLNIDSGLYSYDFRTPELLFTQLTQVAGRAGRGNKAGLVLLQTHYPTHQVYQYLINHDFSGFANYLLTERKKLNLPPYCHYVILRSSAKKLSTVMAYLTQVISLAKAIPIKEIGMYAPVPAIIQRLKDRERGQLLFYCNNRHRLHQFLAQLTIKLDQLKVKSDLSWQLDVDPFEV